MSIKLTTGFLVYQNLDELVDSDDWEEMAKTNPTLMDDIFKFRFLS